MLEELFAPFRLLARRPARNLAAGMLGFEALDFQN